MCYSAREKGITKLESALIIALIVASILGGYAWIARPPAPTPAPALRTITIVDSAGRYVEVPWPVKRIADLSGYAAMVLTELGAKDTIVGISTYQKNDPWAPNVTDIGYWGKPNIEAIIATKPEVVITLVRWPKPGELEEKLEPLGIRVVRLDLYKIETLFSETKLLGLLVNKTREADELIKYWKGVLDLIEQRIVKIRPEQRVRVYWEHFTDYTTVGPGSGYDELIRLAGGINVFAESPVPFPRVSAEAVIEKNPDVILKAAPSTVVGRPYGLTDPAPLKEIRDRISARPGWANIKAVKEGRIYLLFTGQADGFGRIALLTYVAKAFYPDLFRDVSPEAYLEHWLKNNLGIEPTGIWFYPPLGE